MDKITPVENGKFAGKKDSGARRRYLIWAVLVVLAVAGVLAAIIVSAKYPSAECNLAAQDGRTQPAKSPTTPPGGTNPESSLYPSQRGQYRFAGAATDADICSTIGAEMLGRHGGSAVDAAIAAAACIGVVQHHSCGLGGGHFATIYEKPRDSSSKELKVVLSREVAPQAATEDMYVNNSKASIKGPLSIGVPGEVAGYYAAWQRYGRLDWGFLFQPSIRLCEQGFRVDKVMARAVHNHESDVRGSASLSEIFLKQDGSLINEGDILVNVRLGQTLRRIAEDPHTFYNGSLAQDIALDIQERGGIITTYDLGNYTSKIKEPLNLTLNNGGLTMFTPPPPSGGAIVGFILKILDGYNFDASALNSQSRILTYHRIIEAFKFGFAKRTFLGDEDFVDLKEMVANLTCPDIAEATRRQINDSFTQGYSHYRADHALSGQDDVGTSHLNILALDGAAVALTSTINFSFGSLVRGRRTGIMFNDEMDDFSTPGLVNGYGFLPSPSNFIVPSKMPQSSMSPSLFLDAEGRVKYAGGASGGSRIISSTAQVAMNNLWFRMDPLQSMERARLHHQLFPNHVVQEEHVDQDIVEGLQRKHHIFSDRKSKIGNANSILNNCPLAGRGQHMSRDSCMDAVSDGRRLGVPDGY